MEPLPPPPPQYSNSLEKDVSHHQLHATNDRTKKSSFQKKPVRKNSFRSLFYNYKKNATAKMTRSKISREDIEENKYEMEKKKYIEKEQQIRIQQLSSAYPLDAIESFKTNATGSSGQMARKFDDTDWTPQDSAYGAAFPFCGFIPKRIREAIERILIALAVLTILYWLVTIAMKLTSGLSSSRLSKQNIYLDDMYLDDINFNDDFYVNDDDTYYADDAEREEYKQMDDDYDDYLNN